MARYYEITVGAAQAYFGRCNLEAARTRARNAAVTHGAEATIWRAWHPRVSRAREAFERVDAFGNCRALISDERKETLYAQTGKPIA